jgi:hypothetical protein
LLSNKIFLETPYSPIFSNNPFIKDLNYDSFYFKKESQLELKNNKYKTYKTYKQKENPSLVLGKVDNVVPTIRQPY